MKNQMKKLWAVILALSLVFGPVGCAGKKEKGETEKTEAGTEAASKNDPGEFKADSNGDGKITVGYISGNLTDPFDRLIHTEAEAVFSGLMDDGIIDGWTGVLDGQNLPEKQISCAGECVTRGCDFVFFFPVDGEASDPALAEMSEAGIHVIVLDSRTVSTDDLAWVFSGSDDVEAGKMSAEWVIKKHPDGGKFIHCNGVLGSQAQVERTEGMMEVMKDHPEFEMVADEDTQWRGDYAAIAVEKAISQYSEELAAVICDNDDMSSTAQSVCNASGRRDIICAGIGENETSFQMIQAGELDGVIVRDAAGELRAGVDAMVDAVKEGRGPSEKKIMVPFLLVTEENVDEYLK